MAAPTVLAESSVGITIEITGAGEGGTAGLSGSVFPNVWSLPTVGPPARILSVPRPGLPRRRFLQISMGEYLGPLVAIVVGVLFVVVTLFASSLVRPSLPLASKSQPYECGENPVGTPWGVQFNIRFYVFALVFLIFDVEAVMLLPWALVYLDLGPGALIAGLIFIGMLVLGLADVWAKGDLEWVREEDRRALKARPTAETASSSEAAA